MSTLAELEQLAVDGKPVDPAEMAQAIAATEAAGRIASLTASGKERRAAEKAAADLLRSQQRAKAEGAEELAILRAQCDGRRQTALDALVALAQSCDEYGAAVRRQALAYQVAGIPGANWATQVDPRTDLPLVDGLDPDNYAWFAEGMVVRMLRTAGVTHAPTLYDAEAHLQNVVGEARIAHAVAKVSRG